MTSSIILYAKQNIEIRNGKVRGTVWGTDAVETLSIEDGQYVHRNWYADPMHIRPEDFAAEVESFQLVGAVCVVSDQLFAVDLTPLHLENDDNGRPPQRTQCLGQAHLRRS